jgi:hypothetical protein
LFPQIRLFSSVIFGAILGDSGRFGQNKPFSTSSQARRVVGYARGHAWSSLKYWTLFSPGRTLGIRAPIFPMNSDTSLGVFGRQGLADVARHVIGCH